MTEKQKNISREDAFLKNVVTSIVWFSVFCGAAFGGYKAISQDDVLPIKEISISGEFNQLSAQELHSLIVDGVQGNFFTLSVKDIYQKFYALPWVDQIWVHRVWPDKINIEIRENTPVAILKNKGLLNEKGKVFSTNVSDFENTLPIFSVATKYEQEAIKAYRQYGELLNPVAVEIRKFTYDSRKSQSVFLSNGVELKLGRVNAEQRLSRFIKVYKANLSTKMKRISVVDLRYTNGFAVEWKQTNASLDKKHKQKLSG